MKLVIEPKVKYFPRKDGTTVVACVQLPLSVTVSFPSALVMTAKYRQILPQKVTISGESVSEICGEESKDRPSALSSLVKELKSLGFNAKVDLGMIKK